MKIPRQMRVLVIEPGTGATAITEIEHDLVEITDGGSAVVDPDWRAGGGLRARVLGVGAVKQTRAPRTWRIEELVHDGRVLRIEVTGDRLEVGTNGTLAVVDAEGDLVRAWAPGRWLTAVLA